MNEYSQILKGVLEGIVLMIIKRNETYGYEIVQTFNKNSSFKICEGTIYPLLIRSEKNNWITTTMKKSELGPMRKYYSITDEGLEKIIKFKQNFENIKELVNKIWEE